jgi:hypothetical protein
MISPTGSEQRRSLRPWPRKSYEFALLLDGPERTFFDGLVTVNGAQRWYLPLWHDPHFTVNDEAAGHQVIECLNANTGLFRADDAAIFIGATVFDYEVVEIESIAADSITLKRDTDKAWPAGTRLYPATVARLTDQRVSTSQVRFQSLEPGSIVTPIGSGDFGDVYQGFDVLMSPPDDKSELDAGIERMLVEIDNQQAPAQWADIANRPFTYQQFAWVLEGRTEYTDFIAMLQYLRGRAVPIWVPTFMDDFTLKVPVEAGDDSLTVARSGLHIAGGEHPDRKYIRIETTTETYYRSIVGMTAVGDDTEVLNLGAAIAHDIAIDAVQRISFMTLMRMNQDNVSIEHATDITGISTALATFRSAPNTRIPPE